MTGGIELTRADRWSARLLGGSFLVVVVASIALAPVSRAAPVALIVGVAAYAIGSCVEFEIGPGWALPTTPIQAVLLFVLTPRLVPAVVFIGLVLADWLRSRREHVSRERLLVTAGNAWQSIGPAAVFTVAHVVRPEMSAWPVYVGALAAQLSCDAVATLVRNTVGRGVPASTVLGALRWTFAVDVFLAPLGVAAALGAPGSVAALLFLAPMVGLLAFLQHDRAVQLAQTARLAAANLREHEAARRDPLTGTANRLAWEEALVANAVRDIPVGVIVADVDRLKLANDTYGHEVGDRLLVAVAEALLCAVRSLPAAAVYRTGGDEFAVLMENSSRDATQAVAQVLSAAFAASTPLAGSDVPVSASIGASHADPHTNLSAAIAAADREAAASKRRRNLQRA